MALSMVHLLLARRWARGHEEYLECPEFYLGAISPDAMHIRFHDDKSRKDEFHLGNWGSVHEEKVHAYWREHLPLSTWAMASMPSPTATGYPL